MNVSLILSIVFIFVMLNIGEIVYRINKNKAFRVGLLSVIALSLQVVLIVFLNTKLTTSLAGIIVNMICWCVIVLGFIAGVKAFRQTTIISFTLMTISSILTISMIAMIFLPSSF